MSPGLDSVLNVLYHAKREREHESDPGWLHADSLTDQLNDLAEFRAYGIDEVFVALNMLEGLKLAENDRTGFWRIAQRFYNDLDEWCERVLEVLELDPDWRDPAVIRVKVTAIHHVELSHTMFAPIKQHLADKFASSVEFHWGLMRIRTEAWLKRCQTLEHSS